jgi:Na+-translocating ferredoxin:NAD+ oxidoreductase subunit D
MREVLIALIPGVMAMIWFFGWGVVINIVLASVFAVAAEAAVMRLRAARPCPRSRL